MSKYQLTAVFLLLTECDWYTPPNAHRQTPEEVRAWCSEIDLIIEHEYIEKAGITIIAKKPVS